MSFIKHLYEQTLIENEQFIKCNNDYIELLEDYNIKIDDVGKKYTENKFKVYYSDIVKLKFTDIDLQKYVNMFHTWLNNDKNFPVYFGKDNDSAVTPGSFRHVVFSPLLLDDKKTKQAFENKLRWNSYYKGEYNVLVKILIEYFHRDIPDNRGKDISKVEPFTFKGITYDSITPELAETFINDIRENMIDKLDKLDPNDPRRKVVEDRRKFNSVFSGALKRNEDYDKILKDMGFHDKKNNITELHILEKNAMVADSNYFYTSRGNVYFIIDILPYKSHEMMEDDKVQALYEVYAENFKKHNVTSFNEIFKKQSYLKNRPQRSIKNERTGYQNKKYVEYDIKDYNETFKQLSKQVK